MMYTNFVQSMILRFMFVSIVNIPFFRTLDIEPIVVLTDTSGGHTLVGEKLILECNTTFSSDYILVKWDKQNDNNVYEVIYTDGVEEIVSNENTNSTYLTTARLIIQEATLSHAGRYRCKVILKRYDTWSDELFVPVYKPNEHFIQFADDSVNVFNVSEARIDFHYIAHPNSSLLWAKNNERIEENSSRYSIQKGFHKYKGFSYYYATLQFKHFSKEDFGEYTLTAQNDFGVRNQTLKVDETILWDDTLILDIEYVNQEKKLVTYVCKAVRNPKPKIAWSLIPCLNGVCDRSNRKVEFGDRSDERGLQILSYKTLNISEHDFLVTCLVGFIEHWDIFYYLPDGFGIFGKNVENDGEKTTIEVGFREYATIACVASSFGYVKRTRWYRNGEIVSSGKVSLHTSHYYTLDNVYLGYVSSILIFKDYSQDWEGNYTCEAIDRTGKIHWRNITVVSKHIESFYPQLSTHISTGDYATVGENVTIKCEAIHYTVYTFTWDIYDSKFKPYLSPNIEVTPTETAINRSIHTSTSKLEISNIKSSDAGTYYCHAIGLSSSFTKFVFLHVFDVNEDDIIFDDKSFFDEATLEIVIFMRVRPKPTVKWFDNHGTKIKRTNSSKFSMGLRANISLDNYYNYRAILLFKNMTTQDFGNYTAVVSNKVNSKPYSVRVRVTKPSTSVKVYKFNKENMTVTIKCTSVSYPEPSLYWKFRECGFRYCLKFKKSIKSNTMEIEGFSNKTQMFTQRHGLRHISYISVNFSEAGIFTCYNGNSDSYANIVVSDLESKFALFVAKDIVVTNDIIEILQHETFSIICAISASSYRKEIVWFKNEIIFWFKKSGYFSLFKPRRLDLVHSFVSILTISPEQMPKKEGKNYTCKVLNKNGRMESKILKIKRQKTSYASFIHTNMKNDSVEIEEGTSIRFYCYADGFPAPLINWFRDNTTLLFFERAQFSDNHQVLDLQDIHLEDAGTYKCEIYNRFNKSFGEKTLITTRKYTWLYGLIPALLVAVLSAIFFTLKLRKNSTLLKELKQAGLANFEQGEIENLIPDIMVKDQAELLPYDDKWEIPRQNIKIGKQLGSGAFGVVFKAEIVNFFPNEDIKTVAVKTTHKNSSFECIKLLASELKIMVHLGEHVNVVNFIGACTKNLTKKELYVVVEYCHLGNLLEYLIQRNRSFVDQKDYTTDEFNWTICPDTKNEHTELRYVNVKESEDKVEFSKKPHQDHICSRDFLVWAFQIARGMEYLGSRRVVHGDLAARNILLTEDNVVKISDFGLAKKMYKYRDYVKKGDGPLPVKWLAVETIGKGIFSIQSDVWSFGIVLWELFSLGETPYPGIDFNKRFYKLLIDGYRMESPKSATATIYEMMLDCWKADPVLRPSFANLADRIGSLLEASVKKRCIDMNDRYNEDRNFDSEDYLGKLSIPTFEHVVSAATLKYASIEHVCADNEDENDTSTIE